VFAAVISEEGIISSQVHSDSQTWKRRNLWLLVDLMLPILDLAVHMILELKLVASIRMEIIFLALWARCTFKWKRKHCFWHLVGVFVFFNCNGKSGMFYCMGIYWTEFG